MTKGNTSSDTSAHRIPSSASAIFRNIDPFEQPDSDDSDVDLDTAGGREQSELIDHTHDGKMSVRRKVLGGGGASQLVGQSPRSSQEGDRDRDRDLEGGNGNTNANTSTTTRGYKPLGTTTPHHLYQHPGYAVIASRYGSMSSAILLVLLIISLRIRQHYFGGISPVKISPRVFDWIKESELERHIRVLASDLMEGRAVGTKGERRAAAYVASEMSQMGYYGGGMANGSFIDMLLKHGGKDQGFGSEFDLDYDGLYPNAAGGSPSDEQGMTKNLSSFYQRVPLMGISTDSSTKMALTFNVSMDDGKFAQIKADLVYGDDFTLTTDMPEHQPVRDINQQELIFGGFCIHAINDYHWSDFESVLIQDSKKAEEAALTANGKTTLDVKDKIVVCLVNQPRIHSHEFGGPDAALTYYGRWMYKLEELRRRQAKGVILLHSDETAGYGWQVLKSASQVTRLRLDPLPENPLQIWGWMSSAALNRLYAAIDGKELAEVKPGEDMYSRLYNEADSNGFVGRKMTEFALTASMRYSLDKVQGINVVGVLPGRQRPREFVFVTAHLDHLGKKRTNRVLGSGNEHFTGSHHDAEQDPATADAEIEEDLIYNGALDNASGVAKLLEIGRIFSLMFQQKKCCSRSLVLLAPTAEEAGLLGSAYYAEYPSVSSISSIVGLVNFDGMNIWGKTRDAVGLGNQLTDMGRLLDAAAESEKMTVSDDIEPLQGLFFRSDQYSFAKKGVACLKLTHGHNYEGHEDDNGAYFNQTVLQYNRERYHQVNDDFAYIQNQTNPYVGGVQEVRIAIRVLYSLLQAKERPRWKETLELRNIQLRMLEREI